MPKIEREYIKGRQDVEQGISYSVYQTIPDGVRLRMTLEWEDPEPPNDWTPEDVAKHYYFNISKFDFTSTLASANKVAELERAACAAIMEDRLNHTGKDGDGWLRGYRDALTWAMDAILFRTNEKAGYPRLEGS